MRITRMVAAAAASAVVVTSAASSAVASEAPETNVALETRIVEALAGQFATKPRSVERLRVGGGHPAREPQKCLLGQKNRECRSP